MEQKRLVHATSGQGFTSLTTVIITGEEYYHLLQLGEKTGLFCAENKFDEWRWLKGIIRILGRERANVLLHQQALQLKII